MQRRFIGLVPTVAILALALWLSGPLYNWDLLAYVGVARTMVHGDAMRAHAETYALVGDAVPDDRYRKLLGKNHRDAQYRSAVADNPGYFAQQLPFYAVKPLYPGLIFALARIGFDPVEASVLISQVSYFLMGVLIYSWISRHRHWPVALWMTVAVTLFPAVLDSARYSSPDALSALFLLLAFFLIIEYRMLRTGLAIVSLSVLIRPDNLILCFLLAAYTGALHSGQRLWASGAACLGLAIYLLEARWSANYGWTTLFYHSFVEFLNEPRGFASPLVLHDYLQIYWREARSSLWFFVMLVLALVPMLARCPRLDLRDPWIGMSAVNLFFMASHWVVFPAQKERLLIGSYVLVVIMILVTVPWRGLLRAQNAPGQRSDSTRTP